MAHISWPERPEEKDVRCAAKNCIMKMARKSFEKDAAAASGSTKRDHVACSMYGHDNMYV